MITDGKFRQVTNRFHVVEVLTGRCIVCDCVALFLDTERESESADQVLHEEGGQVTLGVGDLGLGIFLCFLHTY